MMGFLDNLCGARQSDLKVKEPERFGFDPRRLVTDIASVMVHIWQVEKLADHLPGDGFTSSLVVHPDYSRPAMAKVSSVLHRHQLCSPDILPGYDSFLQKVEADWLNARTCTLYVYSIIRIIVHVRILCSGRGL